VAEIARCLLAGLLGRKVDLTPGDPARVLVRAIRLTPDGEGYAYGYGRFLQYLYLVESLRF